MQWTSHTEAGGDTALGEGGVPAFVWKKNLPTYYIIVGISRIREFVSFQMVIPELPILKGH